MTETNPYATPSTASESTISAWRKTPRLALRAMVFATLVSIAMYLSLTAAFSDGLVKAVFGGSVLGGGILTYASGGVSHLPIINLVGASICVTLLPRLGSEPARLPSTWVMILTCVIAYFAMTLVDTQRLVKTAMLNGQAPFLNVSTLLVPILVWIVAMLLTFASFKLFPRRLG